MLLGFLISGPLLQPSLLPLSPISQTPITLKREAVPYASSLSWSRHIMGPQQIWSNLRMSRKVNRQEKRDQGVSWDKVLCKHSGVAREPGAFWGWTKDRVWAAKRLKTMPVTEDNQFTFRSDKTKQNARSPAFPHKSLERIKSSPRPSSP